MLVGNTQSGLGAKAEPVHDWMLAAGGFTPSVRVVLIST